MHDVVKISISSICEVGQHGQEWNGRSNLSINLIITTPDLAVGLASIMVAHQHEGRKFLRAMLITKGPWRGRSCDFLPERSGSIHQTSRWLRRSLSRPSSRTTCRQRLYRREFAALEEICSFQEDFPQGLSITDQSDRRFSITSSQLFRLPQWDHFA